MSSVNRDKSGSVARVVVVDERRSPETEITTVAKIRTTTW